MPPDYFSSVDTGQSDYFNTNDEEDPYGLGLDPVDLSSFSNALSPTQELGYGTALESSTHDSSKYFGGTVDSPFSKARDLLNTENEITLERVKKLQTRALTPNYQMSPTEAWATTALALLPTAFGYVLGGKGGGALGAQAAAQGIGSLNKSFQDADTQSRQAALELSKTEQQRYQNNVNQAQSLQIHDLNNQAQVAAREDTQANQRELLGMRTTATGSRGLTPFQQATNERAKQKAEREQNALDIPGLGRIPGYQQNPQDYKDAQEASTAWAPLATRLNVLQNVYADPNATTQRKVEALNDTLGILKEVKNFGAALSTNEEVLLRAGFPREATLSADGMTQYLRAQAQGDGNPLEKVKTVTNLLQKDYLNTLQLKKYYAEGMQYDPGMAQQFGIPVDKNGTSLNRSLRSLASQEYVIPGTGETFVPIKDRGKMKFDFQGPSAQDDIKNVLREFERANNLTSAQVIEMYKAGLIG